MENLSGYDSGGYGTLYIVATPIGNLEDITIRALRILRSVVLISAENELHTRKLCGHYGISTRLTAYNQHNEKAKTPELISKLKSGYDVAVVTNAGTPGISDPGVYLINRAAEEGIKVSPIPGPSAVIAGLSISGLAAERFLFLGFLPSKRTKRKKVLNELISEPKTMVFYEAPHRLKYMLIDLMEILGDRQMVMLREMTKMYEETKKGLISSILEHLDKDKIRGEFTLVVVGRKKRRERHLDDETLDRIKRLLAEKKMSIRDIAELLSREEGLTYRRVYKECLAGKKDLEDSKNDGHS